MSEKAPAALCRKVAEAPDGGTIEVWGDGRAVRTFIYVEDLVEGVLRMMDSDAGFHGPVNLGNPDQFTMIELAGKVLSLTSSSSRLVHRPLPADDPRQRRPDISLAGAKLGWAPRVSLEDGLKETVAYFRKVLA